MQKYIFARIFHGSRLQPEFGCSHTIFALNSAAAVEWPLVAQATLRGQSIDKVYKSQRSDARFDRTPYGSLTKSFEAEVQAEAGAIRSWCSISYACPCALLWLLCQTNRRFFQLLRHASNMLQPPGMVERFGRLAIYFDDVMPGNVHRPDKGRKYMAVYWTLLDFPLWMLQSGKGWFVLTYVPAALYKKMLGAEAQLLRLILKIFFPDPGTAMHGFSFSTATAGVVVAHDRSSCAVAFRFSAWLSDGDAFPKIGDNKSTSGTKPCPMCKNVLGRCKPEDVPADMVHLTSNDPSQWARWTADELRGLQPYLAAKRAELSDTAFNILEQKLGWKLAPHGLLASDMAEIANLPDSLYMDWMHTLCSSGGMAQYELNQFLRRLVYSVPPVARLQLLQNLDDFRRFITFPKHQGNCRGVVLKERIVNKPGAHVRMFATECLQVLLSVCLWAELQPEARAKLPEHVESLLLLGRIIYILRTGNRAVQKLPLLRQLVGRHHETFLKLYEQCFKVKPHLLWHILEALEKFRVNLSCFSTERKHKASKQIGAFAYYKWCETMLRRVTLKSLEEAAAADWCEDFALEQPESLSEPPAKKGRKLNMDKESTRAHLIVRGFVLEGKCLRTPVGSIYAGDLVAFLRSGLVEVGFVIQLLQHEDESFHCFVRVHARKGGAAYSTTDTQKLAVPIEAVIGTFPWLQWNNSLILVASADCLS